MLHLADRLSLRGGADQHLRAVLVEQAGHHRVTLAVGRVDPGVQAPAGVRLVRVPGLERGVAGAGPLPALEPLLDGAEVHHLHNVMDPVVLRQVLSRGRGLVTVQDHRVFCPGPGRTRPDGAACAVPMGVGACAGCFEDTGLAAARLALTQARRDALTLAQGLVVLSSYMAGELAQAGLPGAVCIPPWVAPAPRPAGGGWGFLLGGRLVWHKAPLLAWEAWDRAGRPQPLRVAGAGALLPRLEGAEALGWLPAGALTAALRASRALLFPARWQEPFGLLGLEAQAQGVPVLVTRGGGVGDWAGRGALQVEPRVEAMQAGLLALHEDPAAAQALGEEGWAQARARFTRAALAPRLEALLQRAAQQDAGA